jgi:hypothetical protein
MTLEIRAEAALFPEKEYISGIFVAVWGLGQEKNFPKCKILRKVVSKNSMQK